MTVNCSPGVIQRAITWSIVRSHLDTALVDVVLYPGDSAFARLREQDRFFEEEYATDGLSSSLPDDELVLPQKHALLVQIHLYQSDNAQNNHVHMR